LLPKDNVKETALHSAAVHGGTELLQILWEWGNESVTPDGLKSNLLPNKNCWKQTALHVSAYIVQTEVLQKLWEWSTEKLSAEVFKNIILTEGSFHKMGFSRCSNWWQ
jgi:hypothetical protein